jgi:hypothetical protein
MIKGIIIIVMVLSGTCLAQLSNSEIARRMAELNARASAKAGTDMTRDRRPSTRPSSLAAPATSPAQYRWIAKPGAPLAVREWIAKQPYLQADLLRQAADAQRAPLQTAVDQARAKLAGLEQPHNFHVVTNPGRINGSDYTDRAAEGAWYRAVVHARRELGDAIRALREFDDASGQRMADAMRDPKIITALVAGDSLDDLAIGNIGAIGQVRIVRIVDPENMIVALAKGGEMWCKGFSTAGIVDDQHKFLDGCIITGTQRDNIGRTMFVAEPFDAGKWIELQAQ